MAEQPYLYLLIRNDLNSLNTGKAVAHGAHAANQFTFETARRLNVESSAMTDRVIETTNQFESWVHSACGFGTTITLHVSLRELQTAVMVAKSMAFMAGETTDPTYPYLLHREYANLIDHAAQVSAKTLKGGTVPLNNEPTHTRNDMMLCLREEITAGYVFGLKSQLNPILGNFPLMP